MCVPGQPPGAPATAGEAIAMARAGLAWLAEADVASLPTAVQAGLLRDLERAESAHTAARANVLGVFSGQLGFEDDGHRGARSWLMWQTQVTRGAAGGAVGWARRLPAHPLVAAALAGGQVSASWARHICDWSDLLPAGRRDGADQILLAAAAGGAQLADLSGLAEEMYRRCAQPDADPGDPGPGSDGTDSSGGGAGGDGQPGDADPGPGGGGHAKDGPGAAHGSDGADGGGGPGDGEDGFADRLLQLDLHFRGSGRLTGDLTPECAAALAAVLEALGRKAGPEDRRTRPQRDHDALEEACRRLIGAGGLPDRAGQPTQVQLTMTLSQLRALPGAAAAEQAWGAGQAGGEGTPGWAASAAAAAAYACDAQITPMVTGHVNRAALARLTAEFLATLRAGLPGTLAGTSLPPGSGVPPGLPPAPGAPPAGQPGIRDRRAPRSPDPAALPPRTLARLHNLILAHAADVLSGPAGLASFLRAGLLASEFPAAQSLPLDVGTATATVPPHLRRAVIARDRHCAAPGCTQKPAACHVHHIKPRSQGGTTCLTNLLLLCPFHHLIWIHRWGWTITLNPDATTTATSPNHTTTLHSHGPPHTTAA
ncbi:MAG TPA: HNH endonuclease signature motif containing protein [Streptosporangiaceae bacterium]